MAELTAEDIRAIHVTHDTVTRLETVLLGVPGSDDVGLVGEVKNNQRAILVLAEKHTTLSHRFWYLIGVLVGSGVLATGAWQILR